MFKLICEFYLQHNNLNIGIKYTPIHGGGDTTADVLSIVKNEKNNFCLAIVDSDKKCPTSPYGSTLKKVMSLNRPIGFNCDYIFSENFQETENLIPLKILEMISLKSIDWKNGYDMLNRIFCSNLNIHFYDLKFGVTSKKYMKLKNPEVISYITEQILLCSQKNQQDLDHIRQQNEDTLTHEVLLQGLGSDVLNRAVQYISSNKSTIFSTIANDIIISEWLIYGKELLNWICSSSPKYA